MHFHKLIILLQLYYNNNDLLEIKYYSI